MKKGWKTGGRGSGRTRKKYLHEGEHQHAFDPMLLELYTMREKKSQFCLICMAGAAQSNYRIMNNMFKPSTLLHTHI